MDPAIKSLVRSWRLHLLVVVISSGILIAAGEKSILLRASRVADLSASRPGTVLELSKSKEWLAQARFFNKAFFGPESIDWRNSPAAQEVSASITQLQRQPKDNHLATIWINGPDEDIATGKYTLEVRSRALNRDVSLPTNILVGPLPRNSNSVSLQIVAPGFFGSSDITGTATVSPATLEYDSPVSVVLPVLQESRTVLGQESVHFRLQLMKLDLEQPTTQAQYEAAASSSDIASKVVKGNLAFDELNINHDLLITPAGRYTTLIITGDGDLKNHVHCERTDSGKWVGAYSDQLPLMVAAVNDWASIKVHITVRNSGEKLRYRIVDLSGDDVPDKALLLWFVVHDLTSKEIEDRVVSLPEIDDRARWLEKTLDVKFTEEDAVNAANPEVKQLLNHLRKAE